MERYLSDAAQECRWLRSSFADPTRATAILVRHNVNTVSIRRGESGLVLVFDNVEWEDFVEGAKNGEFDRPTMAS
ncbi:DUF397 domain-containing protein [Plantactinospora siamensis]|uniref:DUF397 domain-containing protein n=1 Tax=Plantactinospora siamensis TaxID=555372 RepID=A0ABV6NU74_9ACTN